MATAQPVQQYTSLIVGYKTTHSDSELAAKVRAKGDRLGLTRRLATGAALVNLGGVAGTDVIKKFLADPDVAYVEPDLMMRPLTNDTLYPRQWDLFEAKAGMNVENAWAGSTGNGVTVAVIDTGYVKHSDLQDNIVAGYDFISIATLARDGNGRDANPADEGDWYGFGECEDFANRNSSWHGTHVAGTIAASTNNNKGVAGVAYNAKIQPVRVLGKCGGSSSDIADAIVWASGGTVSGVPANKTPAKVLNLSLGGASACGATFQNAINSAVGRGSTVVVSAGNSNADAANFQPAGCNNVVSVAASDRDGNRASYSNYGTKVDIAAPGGEVDVDAANGILSTLNTGAYTPKEEAYAYYEGTSMAAPHIAGLAALLLAKNGSLSPAQIEKLIKDNARTLPGSCSGGCGAGLADAAKTVNAVS